MHSSRLYWLLTILSTIWTNPKATYRLNVWLETTRRIFGTVTELVEQDTYPCPVDGPDSEGEVEDPEQPSGTIEAEAAHGARIRQSQRASKPPLTMTDDVMGQPSFQPSSTAGVRGITVSYPQQLWHPVTVPWTQRPVMQPLGYFVPFPVRVQPMYPVPMPCY